MTGAAISRASRKPRCSRALPISHSTGSRFRRLIWWPGFGRIVDLKPQDILVDTAGADDLLAAEERASAHMNEDHADACRLYATKLCGAPDGDWRCAGFDPEGLELQNGRIALRLPFPQRVNGAGPLRAVLVKMAEEARAG